VDLGSVAVIGLIAGLAGGTAAAALVGTVEGRLRRPQPARGSVTYGGRWRSAVVRTPASPSRRYEVAAVPGQPQRESGFAGLDADSRTVLELARQEANQAGHSYVGSENLAMALRLSKTPALDGIWTALAIDPDALRRRIEAAVPPTKGATPAENRITPRVGTIIAMAGVIAAKRDRLDVPPEYLLMALADEGGGTGAQALAALGATAQRIREIIDGPKP
jgi:hypothetical protein